ncbi:hypothetical protein ACPCUV_37535 [Streptomyces platensis]|uniref:hypothetical protein n=1 Tax=Streptomyces platensis TaxID=58346 RepID=UPI003C2D464A
MDDEKTHFVIDQSALSAEADVWYALPPGYMDVPFASILENPGSEAELTDGLLPLMAAMSPQGRSRFLEALQEAETLAARLIREGVIACALGMHEDDDGSLLHSVLTIARVETSWTPAELAVRHAATARGSATPLRVERLAHGPAAFAESEIELPESSAQDTPSGTVYQAVAYLAAPDRSSMAVVSISTTATQGAEGYRSIVRSVAETISFDNPLPGEVKAGIPEPSNVAEARSAFG